MSEQLPVIAYVNRAFAELDAVTCFDGEEPACAAHDPGPWFGVADAAAAVAMLATATLAIVAARRNERRRAARATAVGAIAATWIAVVASALLTDLPT